MNNTVLQSNYKIVDMKDIEYILSVVKDDERVFYGETINEDYSHDELGGVKKNA